ncbi:hypothetical protein ASG93_31860 [Paenibacillus sp. Soil787]|nr:hypothetical protein ASG93_31860 [Paenibacillus sp. Soil787]
MYIMQHRRDMRWILSRIVALYTTSFDQECGFHIAILTKSSSTSSKKAKLLQNKVSMFASIVDISCFWVDGERGSSISAKMQIWSWYAERSGAILVFLQLLQHEYRK